MKTIIIFIAFMSLAGCNKEATTFITQQSTSQVDTKELFEGYYQLENTGYVDLVEDAQELIDVAASRLAILNSDGTVGVIPFTTTNLVPTDKLIYNSQVNIATSSNLKRSNNTVISGNHLIKLEISFDDNRLLKIKYSITSVTGGVIELTGEILED